MKTLMVMCIFVAMATAKIKFSSLTTICSISDPNLDECATKASNEIIPHLVKGIRDYDFPSIDPLQIPFMELSQSDKPVGLKLNMTNTTHEGMRLIKFKAVRLGDLAKGYYEVDLNFPRYAITGICDLGGKILLLPITGHGPCNLTAIDMDATFKITHGEEERGGATYYKITKFDISITFRKGAFILTGLFNGNKELGDTMNRFLNENAVEVLNEMKPTLEAVWAEIYRGLIDRIHHSVPKEEYVKP